MPLRDPLDAVVEHLLMANPFDDNRVTQMNSLSGDVPRIHDAAFAQLRLHAARTERSAKARGVVVSGPPGIGKSHLLARLGQWARTEKYPFVYLLNLQSGPQDMLRTILRSAVSVLTREFRRAPWQTRLFRLVSVAIREAISRYSPGTVPELRRGRQLYLRMLDESGVCGPIHEVLWRYFEDIWLQTQGRRSTGTADLARQWLSGDDLDPEEAAVLGLNSAAASDDGCALSIEDMKQVLGILCRFAGFRGRCFILCFDQVDTLGADQIQSWSATVHALLDQCPGLLVVTSGVDETFLRWTSRNLVSQASWDDRIRQFSVILPGIDSSSATEILKQRLQESLQPLEDLPEIAALRRVDQFFPLGRNQVDRALQDSDGSPGSDLRPRDVICRAGAVWEAQSQIIQRDGIHAWLDRWTASDEPANGKAGMGLLPHAGPDSCESADAPQYSAHDRTAAVDRMIDEKCEEHVRKRRRNPEELPVDAGNLTGLLPRLLAACADAPAPFRETQYGQYMDCRVVVPSGPARPAFQLIVEQVDLSNGVRHRIGVRVAETTRGQGATNMLSRVRTQLTEQKSVNSAILIVDARAPLQPGQAGQQHLAFLTSRDPQFRLVTLTFDEYAELDALEGVAGLARAGDLEMILADGSRHVLTEAEVQESYHRRERYFRVPLMAQLLGMRSAQAGLAECGTEDCGTRDVQMLREHTAARLALQGAINGQDLTESWIQSGNSMPSAANSAQAHELLRMVVLQLQDEGRVRVSEADGDFVVVPVGRSPGNPTT